MPESKSELKRLCVQKPISMAEYMHKLQQENAKLREELKLANYNLEQTRDCLLYERNRLNLANELHEAAEAKLKAASEQMYVAEVCPSKDETGVISVEWAAHTGRKLMFGDKLYAYPVPPVDVQELQRQVAFWKNSSEEWNAGYKRREERIAELERKLAVALASVLRLGISVHAEDYERLGGEELHTLLAQAREEGRRGAVPDADWLSNAIREVDGQHNLGAGALAEMLVSKMLSASPKPE